jgi:ribonucleotide reductase alpha subunit
MRIERRHTTAGQSPYAGLAFRKAASEIRNPDGSIVFRLDGIDVPEAWSQVACDVLAQKYFRKAGVPARLRRVEENQVPSWLWRSVPDEPALATLPEAERFGSETSAAHVFDRLAGCWTYWGWKGGYFTSEEDARAFHDELCFMLAAQMCAPNSPQWFNTGCTGPTASTAPARAILCRPLHGEADAIRLGLRAPAAACLLHPGRRRRPRERGRHHGPLGPGGAALQVRLGHRLELSRGCAARARSCPAAASRPASCPS